MKQTLTFNLSTIASTASKMDVDAFDKSRDLFEEKNYLNSFYTLLDYINREIRAKHGNAAGTEFAVPHGSIVVHVKIENEQVVISAPFLALPAKNRVPLLRQVAGLNFNNMDLAQITLKDNRLFFEYSCPLSLADPYKMYYVLEEICLTGDKYDDEFVTKFGAERIYVPKITPYDKAAADEVYNVIQLSCEEGLEALKYFEGARKYGYAWNVAKTTLMKILYCAHPQGQLLNDLNKAVWDMDREDIPLPEVVVLGKQAIEKIQSKSKEKLTEDLYYVETFVPAKRRSNLKNIQENLEDPFENISKAYDNDDYIYCCLVIVYQFYRIYYYNNVQDDLNGLMINALQETSTKSFEEAAPVLFEAMDNLMEGNLESATPPVDMSAYMKAMQEGLQNINMEELAKNMQNMMSSMFGGLNTNDDSDK